MNRKYGEISAKELIGMLRNEDWIAALRGEFKKDYLIRLFYFLAQEERRGKNVLPPAEDLFRAFRLTPLKNVKAVILGQDPYPTLGDAHGLAFSVRKGVRIPRSLNNIYIELHHDLVNRPSRLSCSQKEKSVTSFFSGGNLETWAEQGVLLLNTVLTVNEGEPNSHAQKGWEQFTDAAIQAVVSRDNPSVFILWGANARKKKELLYSCGANPENLCVLESAHPSPLSARKGFFGSAPFSKTNQFLESRGVDPIKWIL